MARSSYIWIVQDRKDKVLAGFTVKHELEDWLDGHGRDVKLTRLRDGGLAKQEWMKYEPIQELDPVTLKPIS